MAGLIPRQFIDELLTRTDIVELVNARISLKKAGKNYQACCPFHTEKSPSFTVSRDKQFYHCFGCGAHGNAISFLMEYEKLDFVDTVDELASFHGLEVPREENNQTPAQVKQQQQIIEQRKLDYLLMEEISKFYQLQFKQADDKNIAIDYLKNRGLTGEIAKRFAMGYISDHWDGMMSVFATSHQKSQQLIDLGMAIQGDKNKPYDRFRGRIMFPIRDKRGRVVGFGGRVIHDGTPKYLNSPETRIYHKGQELYGLYEAKQACKNLSRLVVVEGYMDVVALAQHGIDYAVASLGTSTTVEQLQTLFRTVKEVICCYDGDRAGRDAAWRAMQNALPLIRDGYSLKFVFVPDGEDPDSLVREQGKASFERLLDQAKPLSEFLFEHILSNVDINSMEGRSALVDQFQPYLEKLPESILKDSIINRLANQFGTAAEQQKTKLTQNTQKVSSATKHQVTSKITPVRLAIALLLEHPHIVKTLDDISVLQHLTLPGIPLLNGLMALCKSSPHINSAQILEYYRNTEEGKQLAKLMCWQHNVNPDAAEAVFEDSIEKLFNQFLEIRTENLLQKARLNDITAVEKQELQILLNNP